MFSDALLTLAYPQACAMCGRSVEERKYGVACESCWQETRIFADDDEICWKCGSPGPACGRCKPLTFTVARAVGTYKGALRESVLMLKRRPYVPPHVENLLVAMARREPLNMSKVIMPVPLHLERIRARGFNQASVLVQALSKSLRLPVDDGSLLRVSGSEKYRAGLDVKGRRDTVAGAFKVSHPRIVVGEDILLVDDVFTTGATVSACAEALLGAGAKSVFVLTLARA